MITNTRMLCEWYPIRGRFYCNPFDLKKKTTSKYNHISVQFSVIEQYSSCCKHIPFLFTHSLVSGYMVYFNFHYYESHIKYLCMGLGMDMHFSFTLIKQPEWVCCIILFQVLICETSNHFHSRCTVYNSHPQHMRVRLFFWHFLKCFELLFFDFSCFRNTVMLANSGMICIYLMSKGHVHLTHVCLLFWRIFNHWFLVVCHVILYST